MEITNDGKISRQTRSIEVLDDIVLSPSDIHGLDTSKIVQTFERYRYSCKPAAKLRGISGVLHDFDFVCTNLNTGEKLIVNSLLHLDDDAEKIDVEMVKLRLSTYDCSPDACLVVSNALCDRIRQMAGLYRFTVIDTGSNQSPYEQIESLLKLQA